MSSNNTVLHGPFLKNVITLFSGSAVAQLIGFAFMPVLTRLFTPEEFGIYYLFLTTASILSLIITGGYEKAYVLPSSDRDAKRLFLFSLFLISFAALFLLIIAAFLSRWSDSIFQTKRSRMILLLIPVYSLLLGSVRMFQNWSIRNKKYNHISGSNIIRNGSFSILQAAFGILNSGNPGLVLGGCLGEIFPLGYLITKEKRSLGKIDREEIKGSFRIAKKYSDFPGYKMPADIINELSIQSPVYVLSSLFGKAITGIYTLPNKVLNQPSRFIGRAAGEVYYRQASELNSQGKDISELSFSLFKLLFLLGIIPFAVVSFWGEDIFSFVFGVEWEYSGRIAAWLSPWLLFVFAASPVSSVFLVKNKIRLSFNLNLILLALRLGALLTGALIFNDLKMTIILFAIVSLIYWIFISLYSLTLASVPVWRPVILITVSVMITTLCLGVIKYFLPWN